MKKKRKKSSRKKITKKIKFSSFDKILISIFSVFIATFFLSGVTYETLFSNGVKKVEKNISKLDNKNNNKKSNIETENNKNNAIEDSSKNPNAVVYKVLEVIDGDTIIVKKIENNSLVGDKIKVRFLGIDAPESKQDYGIESRNFLAKEIKDKEIVIYGGKQDRYGRLLGVVYYNNENINEKMVKTGNAWWYEAYDKKNTKMKKLQEEAMNKKIGVFSRKNYIEPWNFRKMKK